jgi:hypothetical protein
VLGRCMNVNRHEALGMLECLCGCATCMMQYVIALLLYSVIVTASLFCIKTLHVNQHIEDDSSSNSFHVIAGPLIVSA